MTKFSVSCVHLYNNTNINTESHCQNYQSHMFTYLPQHTHIKKGLFPKCPISHMYIYSILTQTYSQRLVDIMPSLIFVNTLYDNTYIETKAR